MGWLRALAAVVVCGGLVGGVVGCSDDGPEAGPSPSPTVSVSTSGSASPSEEAPVEPVLPEAAKVATESGARAFIAYYWELINYAQVTGDVAGLEKVSGPKCRGCRSGVGAIREHYRAGGTIKGGAYSVKVVKINRLRSSADSPLAFEAKVVARNAPQEIIAADGSVTHQSAGRSTLVVAALWISGHWRLEAMEPS